jgi:hypothetical protein
MPCSLGRSLFLFIASTQVQDAALVELPTTCGVAKMLGTIETPHRGMIRQGRKQKMGPVEKAIRTGVAAGMVLGTVPNGAPFKIGEMDDQHFRFFIGAEQTLTTFKWQCLEDVVPFLKRSAVAWVRIGSVRSVSSTPGTLDHFLKNCGPNRMTSNYVAAVLERAGVVEARTQRPAAVRLRKGW